MNDHGDDAQPDLPGSERRRLQTSRLVQYLLLQALIVAACIFALRQSLPEPPAEYQVTAFRLSESGTERMVTLPGKDEAILSTTVTLTTADEQVATQKLRFVTTKSNGWWVCEVTTG